MSLKISKKWVNIDKDLKGHQPKKSIILPAIHSQRAVEAIDPFELRKISPYDFGKKDLQALRHRFFVEFDTFSIYFFRDAINEKYGFPRHLSNIGKQLIGYYRYNLFVAPRGFSKSTTISAIFPIREIVYHMKKYIVIVSETTDIASDFTETIRFELEQNDLIQLFFGKFRSRKDEGDSTEKWTVADLICKSIDPETNSPFYTRIRARGLGQQIRGKKMRHQRPDLLIFDDMESRLNTETDHQRDKNKRWFNRDALKIMDRYDEETGQGQVVVAGTIVHPESRLNRLKKSVETDNQAGRVPIWKMQFYKAAENHDTFDNPLWPERFGADWLEKEKLVAIANDDYAGFLQEFFNEPVVEEDRKFKDIYFSKRFDFVQIEDYYGNLVLVHENKRYPVRLSAGLDIGGWEERGSDYSALVVGAVAYDSYKDLYQGFVLEALEERLDPSELIDLMFDVSNRYKRLNYTIPWTVETNAFQTVLYHFLEEEKRRRLDFSVSIAFEDHESQNKKGRILSLVNPFKSKFWMFPEHLQWCINRFLNYGLASDVHDDFEDAFQKMHRSAGKPSPKEAEALANIHPMPKKVHVVEPPKFRGNFWAP